MVRPILDYAYIVWSPYIQVNIQKLEMVQRRAARFIIVNNYSHLASVIEMLNRLNLPSLSSRRDNMKLITLYKLINHHHISIPNNDLTLLHTSTCGLLKTLFKARLSPTFLLPVSHQVVEQITFKYSRSNLTR